MAISYNQVPATWRVPGMFTEFDASQAMQGLTQLEYCGLIIAQKTAAGTQPALKPIVVTSPAQAIKYFGAGSQAARMYEFWHKNNSVTRCLVCALDDDESGVSAQASITVSGKVSSPAPINLYLAGQKIRAATSTGNDASTVATAIADAVNSSENCCVTASTENNIVTLKAKNKGECGNAFDLRFGYYGEALPQGISFEITPFAAGAGNPDIDFALAAMGDRWFHVVAMPYTDRANLRAMENELADRWGPIRQIDGICVTAKAGGFAELTTFGEGEGGTGGNYNHISIFEACKSPCDPAERAAAIAANIIYYGSIDQARPFQTLPLIGELAPAEEDRLTAQEQNLLLFSGIATTYSDAGGQVRIQRAISNYRYSASGATDVSYLDLNTLLTLSYLRFDFNNRILRKYPRHKLAGDNARFGSGQAIITPKIGKAEAIAAFKDWEEVGLVEDIKAFKKALKVELDPNDVNRLCWLLPPNLVNQFIVGASQIQFRL